MSDLDRNPFEEAKKKGLTCVVPEPDQLLIDLDDDGDRAHMLAMLEVLAKNGHEFVFEKTTTSAGGNQHVYLRASKKLSPIERVALQACLGSDRKRELLSILRTWMFPEEVVPASCFFEKPGPDGFSGVAVGVPTEDSGVAGEGPEF